MYSCFLTLLLVSGAMAKAGTTSLVRCDGIVFRNVYYDKFLLFTGIERPYNLVMHKYSGNLFFSHTIKNGSQIDFGIMECHIETRTCRQIEGIRGGHAIGYDRGNKCLYFGGHNGIYRYNARNKTIQFFGAKGKSIWGLFIRKNFYYIEYPTQQLYVLRAGNFIKVREAMGIEVDNFFVTRNYEIFFSNKTGFYKLGKPSERPTILHNATVVKQITQDIYGDVYFCASDGIYVEDKRQNKFVKAANINDVYGITFVKIITERGEKYQLVYADQTSIYILLPTEHSSMCLRAIKKAEEGKKENWH